MIEEIKPKSEFLKKYIQSFSILRSNGQRDINYDIFPQIGTTMVLTVNTEIKRFENKIQFIQTPKAPSKVELFGKYLNPVQIRYQGVFDEFSIDFTTLGINYFFDKPYKKLAPNNFQEIKHDDLIKLGETISNIEEIDKKVELAETYFYNAFKDIKIDYLEKAITLIQQDQNITIATIAKQCNMSTRTLNRKFNSYVGCSAQAYKKITRFRNAIAYKVQSENPINFTDVCYDNNFYDASHFLREFKLLTQHNPSNFFNSITEMGISKFPVRFI